MRIKILSLLLLILISSCNNKKTTINEYAEFHFKQNSTEGRYFIEILTYYKDGEIDRDFKVYENKLDTVFLISTINTKRIIFKFVNISGISDTDLKIVYNNKIKYQIENNYQDIFYNLEINN